MSTIPAIGSAMDAKSRSMGAETWVIATRKITTSTSFEAMSAITNAAHLVNQPLVASQLLPERAMGANTIATNSSALRISRLNQTIAAALMARPARKIVMIAPTPGAVILMPTRPAASRAMRSPMPAIVLPVAWTMPMVSWSVISKSSPVMLIATNEPRTALASPRAARLSAVGSRRMSPVISCRQKKMSMRNTATPKSTLYTPM